MKERTDSLFRLIYFEISKSGVTKEMTPEHQRSVFLLNQLVFISCLVNFTGLIFYFSQDLFISALVNLLTGTVFSFIIYLNRLKKYRVARMLWVANVNLYIITINIAEGFNAGEYLLFFPAFISITFIIRIYSNYKDLVITYIITGISAFACILLIPDETQYQLISPATVHRIYNCCLAICMIATIFISFIVLRTNKEKETLILEEQNLREAIYNTSLDGVLIVDAGSHVIFDCNHSILQLFELDNKEQIIGKQLKEWLSKDYIDKIESLGSLSTVGESIWRGEMVLTSRQQRQFYGYASAVLFDYKEVSYIKISIIDITNLKSAEFELLKAKEKAESAAKLKTRFLSNMSHELRTPLNGIIGVSNLMLHEEYMPSQKSSLDILKYSSEHMLSLINEILDFNKIEAGKMELGNQPVNIKVLTEKLISQFSGQVEVKGLRFKTYIHPDLNIELLTDETRIYQILSNLLSNAIKFTTTGTIILTANKIMASSTKATVQFIVQDTGIGIPANKHKEIFESFTQADIETTRKYGGTGLGLTITSELLKLFNSELIVQSEEGAGSKFLFNLELPICGNRKPYIDVVKAGNLQQFEGIKVLVAEDNPINMAVVNRFLTKWGIEAIGAVNGREAVEKFEPGKYDLLLLDLEMPEMDGASALKEIRKFDLQVPIVAFTAAIYENIQKDLKEKGFNDYIHKPFRPEDLHSKIFSLAVANKRA